MYEVNPRITAVLELVKDFAVEYKDRLNRNSRLKRPE
jgi:hypothetical protein